MAKKTSKQGKNEEVKKERNTGKIIKWIVIDILAALLMVFSMAKMGVAGIILNNILTYLLSTLYIIPLLCVFMYGIFTIFFKNKIHRSIKFIVGVVVLNVFILMLASLFDGSVKTFADLGGFITFNFLKLADASTFTGVVGGVFGDFLYVIFTTLFTETGALIVVIVLLLASIVLLIPFSVFKGTYSSIKEEKQEYKKQVQLEKQKRQLEKARAKEAERLKLAEEMNAQYESEVEDVIEEEPIVEPKVDNSYVLSKKSQYFINLDEDEIYSKKESEPLNKEDIPASVASMAPKVTKTKKSNGVYRLPKPVDAFLEPNNSKSSNINKSSAKVKGEKVISILKDFDIDANLLNTYIGPSVTKFEIKPDSTVKVNKIMNISDNIKMELAAKDIRIEAPIPGRSAVGIEIPNVEPIPVKMIDLMKKIPAEYNNTELMFALGKDLMGKGVYCNLAKMPHLLIAGATGSGKSVCINTILTSFLMRTNPDDVKLILVDPKRVEFTPYHDIPHLLWPVITDATMASNMLKKIVVIMQERYEAFATVGVRDINSFNEFVENHNANLKEGESAMSRLPYMVIVIDELADLMAIAKKDVELSIQRITQLARASGIHLIVATQRPSTDVVTGLIKSNIPSRISFAVASSIDSRTILDSTGAERLLGNGDMLYYPQGENAPIRLQGVYVTDNEIRKITEYVKSQAKPEYEDSYFEFLTNMNGTTVANASNAETNDSLYDEVVEFVVQRQAASTSLLQRRFGIGYNRAARLIDTLEDRGIIGPANGSKPREVYRKKDE